VTKFITGIELEEHVETTVPGSIDHAEESALWIKASKILEVCEVMKENSELDFSFLTAITAVDYVEYFELIYHLTSMRKNKSTVIKSKCPGRSGPKIPSVVSVWQAADLQEREIWDLMGIEFEGHPNLKRILLWEGFDGHPLRKDYIG
jgi:NADH/F420H2 dehydrogenase subunit C